MTCINSNGGNGFTSIEGRQFTTIMSNGLTFELNNIFFMKKHSLDYPDDIARL